MGLKAGKTQSESALLVSSREYFVQIVSDGLQKRQVRVSPLGERYLVDLLEYYLYATNLFEADDGPGGRGPVTLAELYLEAGQRKSPEKFDLLKKLGDRSLYISGFFGDSLERSLVDLDYYAEMGGAAYGWLADSVNEAEVAEVYRIYSRRFHEFVDVLTYISQRSMVQSDQSLLRLYDRYLKTGSELAREQLAEHGVVPLHRDQLKASKQD